MIDCSKTKNYFGEKARMLKSNQNGKCCGVCSDCPFSIFKNGLYLSCNDFEVANPDKAIAIVQKWSDEHPQKTYADDIFEKFPNAQKSISETPKACRQDVYGIQCKFRNINHGCVECWNEVMPEGF